MKIAFIGNPTSISYLVGRELLSRGYDVIVHDNPSIFRTNRITKPVSRSLISRGLRKIQKEVALGTAFDIELRSFSKPVVKAKHHIVIYHGNDLRDSLWPIEYPCFYSTIDLGMRYLDKDAIATGDAVWLPRCFVQDYFKPAKRLEFDGHNLTVGFFPTDPKMEEKGWQGKGTKLLYSAIDILKNRGFNVTLLTPELTGFTSHDHMPELYKQCHVIADQFHPNVGMYGVISMEAIMMNRPVVCHVRDEHFEFEEMKTQIVNCRPESEYIADALLNAVDHQVDPKLISRLYTPTRTADVMEHAFQKWRCS